MFSDERYMVLHAVAIFADSQMFRFSKWDFDLQLFLNFAAAGCAFKRCRLRRARAQPASRLFYLFFLLHFYRRGVASAAIPRFCPRYPARRPRLSRALSLAIPHGYELIRLASPASPRLDYLLSLSIPRLLIWTPLKRDATPLASRGHPGFRLFWKEIVNLLRSARPSKNP